MLSDEYRESWIRNGEVRLKLTEQGAGRAVLFCHGFPDDWRTWRRQMRAVAGSGYHAISFDMRGYGDSSMPEDLKSYTLLKIAGDMVEICKALDLHEVVLVGHDFESWVSWSIQLLPCASRILRTGRSSCWLGRVKTKLSVGRSCGRSGRIEQPTESMLRTVMADLRGRAVLKGAGHWPHLESTAKFNRQLLRFLATSC